MKDSLVGALEGSKGPWMDDNNDLNPCWPTLLSGMCLFYSDSCRLSQFHAFVCIVDLGLIRA